MRFADRADAGRRLARALVDYRNRDPVVLALPRGGLPVAAEIASADVASGSERCAVMIWR